MNNNNQLSPGFITVDEACKIIKSDTRENPVVDMDYIVSSVAWLDRNGPNHNFRIPKIRRLAPDEVYRTKRGKVVEYEQTGSLNVYVGTAFEKELLKKTILDKKYELTGREYQELTTRGVSTVADDAQGRDAVRPRANSRPIAKAGSSIGSGETIASNGEGIL